MKNTKRKIRILSFFLILMFLMIPLLSSPVAAAFTNTSGVDTDYTNQGVMQAWVTEPNTFDYSDGMPRNAIFDLLYRFGDHYQAGSGSYHEAKLTVVKMTTPPGIPQTTSVGPIYLNKNFGWYSTGSPLTITDTWTVEEVPISWTITAWVSIKDASSGEGVTDQQTWSVEVT